MTNKDILKELAALSERITRLEHSLRTLIAKVDEYTSEHISDIENTICDISEEET